MSSIVTAQGVVHYEVYGRGRPVILLHGWLGSWGCWLGTMEALANGYRAYALDFWGFGESDKRRESYNISDFVGLVDQFMERMGINRAPVVGHSMGGTVALNLALDKPNRVEKVTVVGSPIDGRSLNLFLKLAGYPSIAFLVWNSPALLRMGIKLLAPWIAANWHDWYELLMHDLSKMTLESFLWSIHSLHYTDLRPRLGTLRMPALGVYGRGDKIVDPRQAELFRYVANSRVETLPSSRHFPMLDEPDQFYSILLSFLGS
ncbi:MAG: alpha/beta hydrolase [Anaerolineaceae bacterium]|nr:alpha/beta hydrolase [Anaerolineae bacterium]NLF14226.1 alpha/beta hydrolase [Anaerolineaceae bacterium]